MIMGVGKGKPLGSYPAKFNIVDSAAYDEEHTTLMKFFIENRVQYVITYRASSSASETRLQLAQGVLYGRCQQGPE